MVFEVRRRPPSQEAGASDLARQERSFEEDGAYRFAGSLDLRGQKPPTIHSQQQALQQQDFGQCSSLDIFYLDQSLSDRAVEQMYGDGVAPHSHLIHRQSLRDQVIQQMNSESPPVVPQPSSRGGGVVGTRNAFGFSSGRQLSPAKGEEKTSQPLASESGSMAEWIKQRQGSSIAKGKVHIDPSDFLRKIRASAPLLPKPSSEEVNLSAAKSIESAHSIRAKRPHAQGVGENRSLLPPSPHPPVFNDEKVPLPGISKPEEKMMVPKKEKLPTGRAKTTQQVSKHNLGSVAIDATTAVIAMLPLSSQEDIKALSEITGALAEAYRKLDILVKSKKL